MGRKQKQGWRAGKELPPVIPGTALRNALHKVRLPERPLPFEPADPGVAPLVLDLASDVRPVEICWLWPGRIPLRRLTLLAGEPGSAASLVAIDLAARVSREAAWPGALPAPASSPAALLEEGKNQPEDGGSKIEDGEVSAPVFQQAANAEMPPDGSVGPPAKVIFCAKRDDLAETVVPGLARAGADMKQVLCLDGVFRNTWDPRAGWTRELRFPEDLRSLRKAICAVQGVRLVVLDPIEAFCTGRFCNGRLDRGALDRGALDRGRSGRGSQDTEAAVAALGDIARDLNVAIVGVAELRHAARRGGLSGELRNRRLAAGAHDVWGILRDPQGRGRGVMAPLKLGSGHDETPLELASENGQVEWSPGQTSPEPATMHPSKLNREVLKSVAADWLLDLLKEGSRAAREIRKLAQEMRYSDYRLRGAKKKIGAVVHRDGFGGRWLWSLPQETGGGRRPPKQKKLKRSKQRRRRA